MYFKVVAVLHRVGDAGGHRTRYDLLEITVEGIRLFWVMESPMCGDSYSYLVDREALTEFISPGIPDWDTPEGDEETHEFSVSPFSNSPFSDLPSLISAVKERGHVCIGWH